MTDSWRRDPAKVLVVLAWDADAVLPAVKRARTEGIPVIAYDRLIQDKDVFYLTFDNIEVGRTVRFLNLTQLKRLPNRYCKKTH